MLRSQLEARIIFPYFKISCQNNVNESPSVKYDSRKYKDQAFSCDRENRRVYLQELEALNRNTRSACNELEQFRFLLVFERSHNVPKPCDNL